MTQRDPDRLTILDFAMILCVIVIIALGGWSIVHFAAIAAVKIFSMMFGMATSDEDVDSDLCKEIRDEYLYYDAEWAPVREEGKKDMRYIACDPWDPQEKQARKDAERPTLALDELAQYTNRLINDPRQNPRDIKINPRGNGATDDTARIRENLFREIQYNSRAQAAFTTGFQGAVQRSYGYWAVGSRYRDEHSEGVEAFEQELYIRRIPNQDSVLLHPNFKELDASDVSSGFILNRMRRSDFKRKYPHAEVVDFTPDQIQIAPQWINDRDVMVAEYWKFATEERTLYLVESKDGPIALFKDELPKGFDKSRIKRERAIEKRKVVQYETNGIEILNKTEIDIPIIPIVPVFGEELYVDEGGGSKRMFFSLVRRARDPYMYYCYIRSCQAELVGMTPKTPWVGVTGQFDTNKADWQYVNKKPIAYLQYDMILDSSGRPLPPPQRQAYEPAVQGLEILAEGARRAIQAAMGISPLPTAAQRQNEKSGVALQRIESQEDRGSFHFIDSYNRGIEKTGRILDAWARIVYDTSRDLDVQAADNDRQAIRINDPSFEEPDDKGQPVKKHYDMTVGEHGVTVSVGPSEASQREEADDFVTTLVQNIEVLPIAPDAKAKLLSLAVKLKNMGPLGDEMAEIISPSDAEKQREAQLQQAQAQLQAGQQLLARLQQENQQLKLERAGKMIDNQGKMQIAGLKAASDQQLAQLDRDIQVLKALLASKQNISDQEYETFRTVWQENHGAAHDAAMQATQQAHEKDQAALAAAQVSATPDATGSGQGAAQ